MEEEGWELMPELLLVLNSAGSHCCPTALPNSSRKYPKLLDGLGLPEAVQSCIHPQMGDLFPKRAWKNFKSPNHPSPTQQQDQLCPCSSYPPAHRVVCRDEGSRVGAVPKYSKETQTGQITPELGAAITLIVWSQRLCPLHNKFLIAHESFGMFVAKDS